MTIPGVRPLLLPASYTPKSFSPSLEVAPERPTAHRPAGASAASPLTPAAVLKLISQPGWAVVAFDAGVTVFIGAQHFQAPTIVAAIEQAREAGVPLAPMRRPRLVRTTPRTKAREHGTNKARIYHPKPCAKCHKEFMPTGPRSLFCEVCR